MRLLGALRRFRVWLAIPLIAIVLGAWVLIEPGVLTIRKEALSIPAWPSQLGGFRIAVIGDLHVGSWRNGLEKNRDLVARTNALAPDIVALVGDFVHGGVNGQPVPVEPEAIASALAELRAKHGVYAVLGNHDWWYDGPRVTRALRAAGLTVLENQAVAVQALPVPLWIAGVADRINNKDDLPATMKDVPSGATVIVLTHSPDIFPAIPSGVTLTLAGHTHGGQIHLPVLGRPVVPSDFGERYSAGHIVENDRHLFVTTGVGTSILPVRFRVPPEVALLTLHGR
jgi:uncharacterized protein